MVRRMTLPFLMAAVVAALWAPAAAVAQEADGRLQATTRSAEARSAFWGGVEDMTNVFPARARARFGQAVALDPAFGLARAFNTSIALGMDEAAIAREMERAVADAAGATTGELLVAMSLRASALDRDAEAAALITAASSILAADPVVALMATQVAPTAGVDGVALMIKRFPEFAPSHNTLAYQLWGRGDRAGAMEQVMLYVELQPQHPNAHDSYAEILQFEGRLPEALQHYQRAAELDPTFDQAYAGMAEVHVLMGHAPEARRSYAMAADHAPTAVSRINSMAASALTYLVERKPKDAVRALDAAATLAEQETSRGQAAGLHRTSALVEAMFGSRNAALAQLAKAGELGGLDTPVQNRFTALVEAVTGRPAEARAATERFASAVANGTAAQQNNLRELRAVVAIAGRDLVLARTELDAAGAAPLGRALLAEAYRKGGQRADSDALVQEIRTTGSFTPFDVLARAKVARL